ncbi:MAG: hypothetical protein LC802_20350 [Acidobacteria bacterium]|nr:hypothetical protein [Acidobacteriota bacterium]
MNNPHLTRPHARGAIKSFAVAFVALMLAAQAAQAASWKGLEPFISKRADVERVLGAPVQDHLAQNGTLHFNVSGGMVTIFFVTSKFVAAKKLSPALEGTVLQIVLQHTNAADTPESMNLVKNKAFDRQSKDQVDFFLNAKEGLGYTFVGDRLKTTRYSYSSEQLARIQRGK